MRRCLTLLACLSMVFTGTLRAQSPAERTQLRAFQDSLKPLTDRKSLEALERQMLDRAKQDKANPILHLQLGLMALRLRQLGSAKHLDWAISEFEWAVEQKPDWPWPWYGLALAESIAPERAAGMAGGLFTMLRIDRDKKMGAAFASSFRADTNFAEGLIGLVNVVLDQRTSPPIRSTLTSIRKMTLRQTDPDLFVALGRLERLGGDPDSAVFAFAKAKAAGAPAGLMWLELGRTAPLVSYETLLAAGVPTGDSAYFIGAAYDDAEVVALYRDDLEPIVTDSQLILFDAARGQARAAWLRDFWNYRDNVDLLPPGSRMEEHFRRWAYVRLNFRLPRNNRRYDIGKDAFRSGNSEIDDRGIVYMRHGEPSQIINRGPGGRVGSVPSASCREISNIPTTSITSAPRAASGGGRADPNGNQIPIKQIGPPQMAILRPANSQNYGNTTWIYRRPDGDMMLHFAANQDPEDYRLQATVFGLASSGGGADLGGSDPTMRQICRFPGSGALFDWSAVSAEKIRAKNANRLATTTDSWTRTYPQPLAGRPAWFGVGSYGGLSILHLVYFFDARPVLQQPWEKIPVTLRAVFFDKRDSIVGRFDTVQNVPRPKAGTSAIALRMESHLPPNAFRVRLNAEVTPDIGVVHAMDTLYLPRLDGAVLSISDILIGRSPTSLNWYSTPTDLAWLDPLRLQYPRMDTLQVYTEAYGIQPNQKYTLTLTFTKAQSALGKLLKKGSPTIALVEPMLFAESTARIARSVSLASLEPGTYLLEITVAGPNGKVTRSRGITIAK